MDNKGRVWLFGNDIDTDQILPSQYMLLPTIDEMKKHTFQFLRPEFIKTVKQGDVIIARDNFGCGSSREQAPRIIQALGIKAIIAKSFARIFFRNAINIGLAAFTCPDLQGLTDGAHVSIDINNGMLINLNNNIKHQITKLPAHVHELLKAGGLINFINKQKG